MIEEIRRPAFDQGGLRRSAFGKALRYLPDHWEGLSLFLEDPRIRLDNNPAERALRGPVVGRKNFYGNRSKRGARVTPILYSLIETAKLNRNGINPSKYLREAALAAIKRPGAVTLPFQECAMESATSVKTGQGKVLRSRSCSGGRVYFSPNLGAISNTQSQH